MEGVSKNGQKKKVHKGGEAPFFASNPDPREYFWHIFMPLQVILLFSSPSALGKYFPITVSKGGGEEREGGGQGPALLVNNGGLEFRQSLFYQMDPCMVERWHYYMIENEKKEEKSYQRVGISRTRVRDYIITV